MKDAPSDSYTIWQTQSNSTPQDKETQGRYTSYSQLTYLVLKPNNSFPLIPLLLRFKPACRTRCFSIVQIDMIYTLRIQGEKMRAPISWISRKTNPTKGTQTQKYGVPNQLSWHLNRKICMGIYYIHRFVPYSTPWQNKNQPIFIPSPHKSKCYGTKW